MSYVTMYVLAPAESDAMASAASPSHDPVAGCIHDGLCGLRLLPGWRDGVFRWSTPLNVTRFLLLPHILSFGNTLSSLLMIGSLALSISNGS